MTARLSTTAGPTVKLTEALAETSVAEMVAEPCVLAVTKPVLLTVATAALEVLHVALLLTFCVLPSV